MFYINYFRFSLGITSHRLLKALALFSFLIPLGWSSIALGKTFTVDTTFDSPDLSLDDGICMSVSGNCSLRAAVEQASAMNNEDIIFINLQHSLYTLRYMNPNGRPGFVEPLIFKTVNTGRLIYLIGASGGSTINLSRGSQGRLVYVDRNMSTVFGGLTFSGGHMAVPRNAFNYPGGGGGGAVKIAPGGSASFLKVKFIDNISERDDGGAIHNRGDLHLRDVEFTGNKIGNSTADIDGKGGAIYHNGSLLESEGYLKFINNEAHIGGALYLTATEFRPLGFPAGPRNKVNFKGNVEFVSNNASYHSNSTSFPNRSGYGGAIYDEGAFVTFYSSDSGNTFEHKFERNRKGYDGKGSSIFVEKTPDNSGIFILHNTTFLDYEHNLDKPQCESTGDLSEIGFVDFLALDSGRDFCSPQAL